MRCVVSRLLACLAGAAILSASPGSAYADASAGTPDASQPAPPPAVPPSATRPPPGPAPAAAPTPAAPAAPRPHGTVLDPGAAQEVLGKDVHSAKGEDMGHIVNVLVDAQGQPRAAIIDFGGFLGVGSRKIAVDWSILHFPPGDKPGPATLDATRDEVKSAPEYKDGKAVTVVGAGAAPPASPAVSPEGEARHKPDATHGATAATPVDR